MTLSNDFSEKTIDPDPFVQFKSWYSEHLSSGVTIPEAVTLATSNKEGKVSARTVLLKGFSEKGFVIFTNYNSKKGSQLLSNPFAALLFYWQESGRQIRIEGKTEKVADKDSDSYFKTRPRESQLSTWASEQSKVIPGRKYLENRYDFYKDRYSDKPVERPQHWGGFLLIPEWFEFWKEREFRLHDRLVYTKNEKLWVIERLAP
jgi:pyridoxamine 5'-phosphate oxidase